MYVEHRSKIRPGGTHQLNLNNKEVVQLAYPGDRCYVSLLKLYFSKLPAETFEAEVFYHKAHCTDKSLLKELEAWFEKIPVGHNKLSGMLKEMLHAAGIDDTNRSNHSLRAKGIY